MPYDAVAAPGAGYRVPDWGALAGQSTTYAYDWLDRPTLITHPDGSTVRSYYNYLQTALLDENGHQTIRESDGLGRMISVKQYEGEYAGGPGWSDPVYGEASYTYDVMDRLLTATGPDPDGAEVQVGATTTVSYNLLGWKTALSDPDMGAWSYGYDAVGNLIQQTDASRQRTCLYYDALNRLKGKTYTTDTTICPSDPGYGNYAVAHYYDDTANDNWGIGRRTSLVDGSGSTSWMYDERGRVIKETKTIGTEVYATSYGYDAADRVRTMQYPLDNEIVTTTYNAQGLPATLAGTVPYVQSASYDAAGRPLVRILGSNLISTEAVYYAWNAVNGQGRLQQLKGSLVTPPTPLQDLSYTYDAGGNVNSIVDAANSGQRQCFGYDALNRLTTAFTGNAACATYEGGVGAGVYNESYVYARDGNLSSKTGVGTYTYDATAVGCSPGTQATKPHAVRQAGTSSFGYDCNGNMGGRTVGNTPYTLFYDAENRLREVKEVTGVGVDAVYVYDGDGNRVQATTNGVTTHYPGRHFERTLNSGYTKYFSFGGELVSFERSTGYPANTGRRFVLRDHLNSTSVVVNGGGTKLWEERYLPFGEVRQTWKSASEMPVQTPYRYTGQRLEVGVGAPSPVGGLDRGLYDYGARWYDPMLGRFVQADSVVPNPGNPQDLNKYTYVGNNPLRYTDPTGHCWVLPLPLCMDIGTHLLEMAESLVVQYGPQTMQFLQMSGDKLPAFADQVMRFGNQNAGQGVQGSQDGNAAGAGGNPNDPFRGLPERVQKGIERLNKQLARVPIEPFIQGYRAQLARAEYWAKQGRLTGVEVTGPDGVRFDLELGDSTIVEVKYWTSKYAMDAGNFKGLVDQLGRYQALGKNIILEMYQTKTNPLTQDQWGTLLQDLNRAGISLSSQSQLLPPIQ